SFQLTGDPLLLCRQRRHPIDESLHDRGEVPVSLFIQKLRHRIPPPNDVPSGGEEPFPPRLRSKSTARQGARNGLRAFTPEGRGTPHHRAMNTRRLLRPDLPSNRPLGRIGFDAKFTQIPREVLSPFPEGGLPD